MLDYGFTLSGINLPGGGDPMGLWEVQLAPALSFAATAETAAPPTWRVQLPASPLEAAALLQAQAQAHALAWQDLARVESELAQLARPESISFSVADPLAVEKSVLLAAVDRLPASTVSYAILRGADPEEQETVRQWDAFVAEMRRIVTHYAHIHTTIAGSDVGLTNVSWAGDFATHWVTGVQRTAMPLHIQSVQMALDSRLALLRVASVVAAGAVGLAVKAVVPGAQVLLLPAVWRFVRDVLQELRRSWPALQNLAGHT
jgi:hypothetical protein